MATRTTAIALTRNKIHDIGSDGAAVNALLTDTMIGETVDEAVAAFSLDKPRERVIDVISQTTPYFDLSLLTGYVPQWSTILSVEWQAQAVGSNYQPTYLNLDDETEEYQDTTKRYLYVKRLTPVTADITRFRFTLPHTTLTSTSGDDTIPAPYFDAVMDLAASYCCKRLAAHFSAASDPTIAADSVSYRDSQLRMKQSSEAFLESYKRKVGVTEPGSKPASTVRNWDTRLSVGSDWLTHQAGWRSWRRVG